MSTTNENEEQPIVLTKKDLAVASYSISEVFNSYVDRYQSEDYGDMSKEQMETSMNTLRSSFIKFDLVLKAINPKETFSKHGVNATVLKIGDILITSNGTELIESIEQTNEVNTVYNLSVDNEHVY